VTVDQNGESRSDVVSQEWLAQAPKVSDALKKGMAVSVATWSGQEITGTICDREQAGLLLEVREPGTDSEVYSFLPWSSIEQVKIREVAQRRVKYLPG
jgi:hypothetical protein